MQEQIAADKAGFKEYVRTRKQKRAEAEAEAQPESIAIPSVTPRPPAAAASAPAPSSAPPHGGSGKFVPLMPQRGSAPAGRGAQAAPAAAPAAKKKVAKR